VGYVLDWTDLGHVEQPPREGEGAGVRTAAGPWTLDDVRLHRGAQLARQARQLVWERLTYTCSAGVRARGCMDGSHRTAHTRRRSAGIAHNKTLAKLGSSRHKPDQQVLFDRCARTVTHVATPPLACMFTVSFLQTVVPAVAVLSFLRDMPLGKIRFLGGKLGANVEASLEAKTVCPVRSAPRMCWR
jgi:hypothetical protein